MAEHNLKNEAELNAFLGITDDAEEKKPKDKEGSNNGHSPGCPNSKAAKAAKTKDKSEDKLPFAHRPGCPHHKPEETKEGPAGRSSGCSHHFPQFPGMSPYGLPGMPPYGFRGMSPYGFSSVPANTFGGQSARIARVGGRMSWIRAQSRQQ
jgi:hypothetical protein